MRHWRLMLRVMGWWYIPLVGYVRPRLESIDDDCAEVSIALRRRTRNHLKSMYFGALAVGADVAAGLHVFYFADQMGVKPSFAFRSMNAQFTRRAMGTVVFTTRSGQEIKAMMLKAQASKERQHLIVKVLATVGDETVAEFEMELSVKIAG